MTTSNGVETERLLRLACSGDEAAKNELFDRYRGRLRQMVAARLDGRLNARVDPSDVVQDALRDAARRFDSYFADDPQRGVYLWMRQITWDRLTDLHRKHISTEKRSVARERRWAPSLNDESVLALAKSLVATDTNPEWHAIQAEMSARVREALDGLKENDREILVLRHLEELEVPEIAELLGISPTTVTTRHLRALQRLRKSLGDDFSEQA